MGPCRVSKMGKHYLHPGLSPSRWSLSLALVIILMPAPGWGQQTSWERLIDQGNQALARGAPFEAETHYLEALQVADQFAPQDLRRATTRRNLAQALILQGGFETADSLYREAISIATKTLEPHHPYVLSLKDERASLQEAIAKKEQPEAGESSPTSIQDLVHNWAEWLAQRLALQICTALPLSGDFGDTHDRGLGYGLRLHIPLTNLGALSIGLGIDHNISALPAIHAINEPLRLRGTTLAFFPSLGPVTLNLGGGAYTVETGRKTDLRLGLIGGASLAVRGGGTRRGNVRLSMTVRLQGVHILDAAPVVAGPVTFLQAGLNLGWRW